MYHGVLTTKDSKLQQGSEGATKEKKASFMQKVFLYWVLHDCRSVVNTASNSQYIGDHAVLDRLPLLSVQRARRSGSAIVDPKWIDLPISPRLVVEDTRLNCR